jgi:hypothetical protein
MPSMGLLTQLAAGDPKPRSRERTSEPGTLEIKTRPPIQQMGAKRVLSVRHSRREGPGRQRNQVLSGVRQGVGGGQKLLSCLIGARRATTEWSQVSGLAALEAGVALYDLGPVRVTQQTAPELLHALADAEAEFFRMLAEICQPSPFSVGAIAAALGLDTSTAPCDLVAVSLGLDPSGRTWEELRDDIDLRRQECRQLLVKRFGLDPQTATYEEMTAAAFGLDPRRATARQLREALRHVAPPIPMPVSRSGHRLETRPATASPRTGRQAGEHV